MSIIRTDGPEPQRAAARCRSRIILALAVAGSLVSAGGALAAIPGPGTFSGRTSQVAPNGSAAKVTIKTARDRKVKSLSIDWLSTCDNGYPNLVQTTHASGTLTRSGAFHGDGTYSSNSGNLSGTQYTASITDHLKGRFVTKRKARGTFQATAKVMDASGRQVSTCTTPLITWTATLR